MWRRILLPLTVAILIGGGLYAWVYSQNRFEIPPSGNYLGKITGLNGDESIPLIINVSADKKNLLLWIGKKGFEPIQVEISSDAWLPPLNFSSEEGPVEIISQWGNDKLKGNVYLTSKSGRGAFTVTPFSDSIADSETVATTKSALAARAELEGIQSKISESKERRDAASTEVDRLTGFLHDGELLRGSAQKRLSEERQKLNEAKKALADQQAEVKKLDRQVELAYRVTGMGRLVSLARESLEREGRWQESMLRVGSADIPPEVLEQSAKAERILEIKRLIDSENTRIYDLLHPQEDIPQTPPEEVTHE